MKAWLAKAGLWLVKQVIAEVVRRKAEKEVGPLQARVDARAAERLVAALEREVR